MNLSAQATTTSPSWLIDLNQINDLPTDVAPQLVGHKAYNLARLIEAGYQVPEGLCISTEAFSLCQQADGSIVLDPDFSQALLRQFRGLQQRYPGSLFAVRSSAPEEDSRDASWAGIFHSSLNVSNAEMLLKSVIRGFESLHCQQAQLYRQQLPPQDSHRSPTMALIVQIQVDATASGILFSQDPMTMGVSRNPRRCINAVRGLGEELASGNSNGDLYWIDHKNRLLEHRLEPQTAGSAVQPPVLNRQQLRQLGQVATQLERKLAAPQDIEFCYHRGQLWLLQARPIVASQKQLAEPAQQILKQEHHRLNQRLKQLQQQQQLQHGACVLSNSNIAELLPSPTPMSFAVFNQIFAGPNGAIPRGRQTLGYSLQATDTKNLFELVAGQPYFHLELDARCYQYQQPLPIADYLQQIKANPSLANYPEFGLYDQFNSQAQLQQRFGAEEAERLYQDERRFHRNMTEHGSHFIRQYRQWIDSYLENYVSEQNGLDLSQLNAPQLIIQIHKWLKHLRDISCCHFVIAARLGFYFAESLRFELSELLGDQAEKRLGELLQALPGSRINQQCFDLHAVAELQLSETEYLARYGHLASNELEISLPRYHELEQPIDTLLQAGTNRHKQNPKAEFEQQQRRRKRAERKLSSTLLQLNVSDNKRQQLWSDLRLAQRFLPLRETIKYHYTGEYALIRAALLQLEQRLRLAKGQIFYLQPNELTQCLRSMPCARRMIQQRQQYHYWVKQIAQRQPLPGVIFGDQIKLTPSPTQPPSGSGYNADESQHKHNGQPLAPGFIQGRVRLIDPSQTDLCQLLSSVSEQDIIVSRSANLGLAPLMRKVAGLIVEVGGFLSHAACQAREAGIPAMTLNNATELLKDGALIAIDGSAGSLRIES